MGRDRAEAFAPYRVRVHGTDLAFLGADASPLESTSSVWTAGRRTPGLAAAREPRPRTLLRAVARASREADVVVVYLHWGRDMQACPTSRQRTTARALAAAGADVIVGSHAHVLLGSGWQQDTYVNYGLGNFVWYHDRPPDTGVLRLRLEDGRVVSRPVDACPDRAAGRQPPAAVGRRAAAEAIADWQVRRGCAGLASDRRCDRRGDVPGVGREDHAVPPPTDAQQPPRRLSRALARAALPPAGLRRLRRPGPHR